MIVSGHIFGRVFSPGRGGDEVAGEKKNKTLRIKKSERTQR